MGLTYSTCEMALCLAHALLSKEKQEIQILNNSKKKTNKQKGGGEKQQQHNAVNASQQEFLL